MRFFLKVPSLARSVPKPLKVPCLARSVPKPLNLRVDRRAPDASLPSLSTPYQLVVKWNDEMMNEASFGSLIFTRGGTSMVVFEIWKSGCYREGKAPKCITFSKNWWLSNDFEITPKPYFFLGLKPKQWCHASILMRQKIACDKLIVGKI